MTAAKPRASRSERAYREEIEQSHKELDAANAPRGWTLANRVSWLISSREGCIKALDSAKVGLREAHARIDTITAERTSLVSDLRDVQRIADERMRALDLIAGLVGGGMPIDVAHRAHDEIARLRAMRERLGDSETVIAVLAGALAISGQTSAAEWIETARAAAKAARS